MATVMSTDTVMGMADPRAAVATSSGCERPSVPLAPGVQEDPAAPGVPDSVTVAPGAAEDAADPGEGTAR